MAFGETSGGETITITMAEATVACVLCFLHNAKRVTKQNKFLMETMQIIFRFSRANFGLLFFQIYQQKKFSRTKILLYRVSGV